MLLYIRADGNPEIGTGHIMRCVSIAKAAEKQGIKCVFITADGNADELLNKNGFAPINLGSVWNNLDLETDKLIKLISNDKPDLLLVDSYFVTENYLTEIKKHVKIAYIDDLNDFIYPCDVLINYAVYWEKFDYPARYPKTTRLLLGCEYAPLREQFQNLPIKEIKENIETILILTGGTDNYHIALSILEAFERMEQFGGIKFNVLCGIFNPDKERLLAFAKKNPNVKILEPTENIAPLMCEADFAVSAAGTTLYELCVCGTPTVCYTLANNQIDNARGFEERGLMEYAGDARGEVSKVSAIVAESIVRFKNFEKGRRAVLY